MSDRRKPFGIRIEARDAIRKTLPMQLPCLDGSGASLAHGVRVPAQERAIGCSINGVATGPSGSPRWAPSVRAVRPTCRRRLGGSSCQRRRAGTRSFNEDTPCSRTVPRQRLGARRVACAPSRVGLCRSTPCRAVRCMHRRAATSTEQSRLRLAYGAAQPLRSQPADRRGRPRARQRPPHQRLRDKFHDADIHRVSKLLVGRAIRRAGPCEDIHRNPLKPRRLARSQRAVLARGPDLGSDDRGLRDRNQRRQVGRGLDADAAGAWMV